MAAKLGSSDDKKVVPLNPAADDRIEQQKNVTAETFLSAVREIAAINGRMRAINEERKTARKKWKTIGLELGILDATIKMAEWDRAEVRAHFDNARRYAEWLGLPIGSQQELFAKGDDAVQKAEWRALGRVASRLGKAARPPEECAPEFQQHWLAGFNDEDEEAWQDAERNEAQLAAAAAIDPKKPGNVADIAKALDARPAKSKKLAKPQSFDDNATSMGATFGETVKPGTASAPAGENDDDGEEGDAGPVVH